ncbi:MAG: hypothetical protein JWN76_2059 [Chitinophagaceae bacterium]|nr:hypothetical protein [Chitinophagaceae bacterium]
MARVILDVPSEKVQPFLQMVVELGIEKHSVSAFAFRRKSKPLQHKSLYRLPHLRKTINGWEFFKNELEFE